MGRVKLRAKGQLTLPEDIRVAAHLAEGALLDVELTDEGILLKPETVIDTTQAWFWTREWQAGERQADTDDAAGRGETSDSAETFIEALRSRTKPGSRGRPS